MSTKGSLTRQGIIENALQLFSVRGFYNTSIADILAATQLTKGGLYGHFKSKEEIWYAVYDEAVSIWRGIVFKGVREVKDPLMRIELIIDHLTEDYLGADVFDGGCFFLNMLVELSGQSDRMNTTMLKGYVRFSRRMRGWLKEADEMGLLKPGLNHQEITSFIIIAMNGAAALYISSRDPRIWQQTATQLKFYLSSLKSEKKCKLVV